MFSSQCHAAKKEITNLCKLRQNVRITWAYLFNLDWFITDDIMPKMQAFLVVIKRNRKMTRTKTETEANNNTKMASKHF